MKSEKTQSGAGSTSPATAGSVVATQEHAILAVLVNHCGQMLTPNNVDTIMDEMRHEMRDGPCAWAFTPNALAGARRSRSLQPDVGGKDRP